MPAQNGHVEMQRVEITRKQSKVSGAVTRFALNAVLFYCAFHTIKFWVYGPDPEVQKRVEELRKQKEAQKQNARPSDHWQKQHDAFAKPKGNAAEEKPEESGNKITIPIYGWMKELDKERYDADSPEWKAFKALQQDDKATQKLYKTFDAAITKQIQGNNSHLKALAYIKYNGRITRDLNLKLMLVRPPSYAMRCLVIDPPQFGLIWKELDHESGTRMQRLRQPLVLTKAFVTGVWAFTTTTAAITQAKVMDVMYPERTWGFQILYARHQKHTILAKVSGTAEMTHEQKIISKLPSSRLSDQQAETKFPFLKGALERNSSKESLRNAVQSVTHEHALQHSVNMFKAEWIRGQLTAQQNSTPGAISVIGYYDWQGERGRYRVEVLGQYLPRDDAFIGPPMITRAYIVHNFAKPKVDENRIPNPQRENAGELPPPSEPTKRPESTAETPEKRSSPGKETGK